MPTNEVERRRTMAVLGIILDGAQPHDIVEFVRQQEQAEKPDPLWEIPEGGQPLTDEQIADLARQAEEVVILENPGVPAAVAMHMAKLKSLFARAVASQEHGIAARLLQQIGQLEGIAPNAADEKNQRKAQLLLEIHSRHLQIANSEPDGQEWEEDFEHGPRFEPSSWFRAANDRERMAWKRTLDELAEDGLVILTPASPRRVHVALTPAGEELVRRLAA